MNKALEFIYINLYSDKNEYNAKPVEKVYDRSLVYGGEAAGNEPAAGLGGQAEYGDDYNDIKYNEKEQAIDEDEEYEIEEDDSEATGSDTKERRSEKRRRIVHEIISYAFILAAAFILASLANHYLIVNARIPSGSMIPTITEGNRIIGSRLSYLSSDPKRGDIVVFYYPDDEKEMFIKRIIGLPGETIYIENGTVYIDGQALDESDYLTVETHGISGPFTIPDDCYFMMGDNRNNSNDSRYWNNHFVHRDKIIAKALFCYFPTIHLIK